MGSDRKEVLSVPAIDIGALMASKDDSQVEATLQDPEGPFHDTVDATPAAASEWGFFYITNQGVSPEELEVFRAASRDFFNLPKDMKNRIRRRKDNSRGYFDEEFTKNKTDWKEVFDITGSA